MRPKPVSDTTGTRIRETRKRHLWTVDDLAAALTRQGDDHLTASVIGDIESGRRYSNGARRRGIELDELYAIARALECSPLLLLPSEEGPGFLGPMQEKDLPNLIEALQGWQSFLQQVGLPGQRET